MRIVEYSREERDFMNNCPKPELGKWYRLRNSIDAMSGFGQPICYAKGELVYTARYEGDGSKRVWVAAKRHICGGYLEYSALGLAEAYDLEPV
jgi:hypothetical protein